MAQATCRYLGPQARPPGQGRQEEVRRRLDTQTSLLIMGRERGTKVGPEDDGLSQSHMARERPSQAPHQGWIWLKPELLQQAGPGSLEGGILLGALLLPPGIEGRCLRPGCLRGTLPFGFGDGTAGEGPDR